MSKYVVLVLAVFALTTAFAGKQVLDSTPGPQAANSEGTMIIDDNGNLKVVGKSGQPVTTSPTATPTQPTQPMPNQPMPNQPMPEQMPGQPMPSQPVPNQPIPNQPMPSQPAVPLPSTPQPMPNQPSVPLPTAPNQPMSTSQRHHPARQDSQLLRGQPMNAHLLIQIRRYGQPMQEGQLMQGQHHRTSQSGQSIPNQPAAQPMVPNQQRAANLALLYTKPRPMLMLKSRTWVLRMEICQNPCHYTQSRLHHILFI